MARYAYNPFTGNLDRIGDGGSGSGITAVTATNAGSSVFFDTIGTTENLELTDVSGNTSLGEDAGNVNNLGGKNVVVGKLAGQNLAGTGANALGSENVLIGYNCGNQMTTGFDNVGIGANTLFDATTALANTCVGYTSGSNLVSGQGNLLLGINSGFNYGSNESANIILGQIAGTVGESNTIRIGAQGSSSAQQNRCFIAGIRGVTTSNSEIVTIDTNTGQLGSVPSVFSPNSILQIKDDFFSNSVAGIATINGEQSWTTQVIDTWSQSLGTANKDHPGVIGHTAMTSGTRCIALGNAIGNIGSLYLRGGEIKINWVFNIATLSSANRYRLVVGLGDLFVTAVQNNGLWFGYSDNVNSGNWTLNATASGSTNVINTAIPVTTGWHNAQIVISPNNSLVEYFMDGVSIGSFINGATVPLTGLRPLYLLAWVAGTVPASANQIDLFYLTETLTTPR